jgi:Lipoprotein LpqB beta-propeller domain/Sporulation and spore germination
VLGLFLAASLAGCVSLPSGGPVSSYAITQGPGGQSQPYLQSIAQGPGAGWSPAEIVQGFLTASASFGARQQVARDYLTPGTSRKWDPGWSAVVYGNGPNVQPAVVTGKGAKETATVTIGGSVQAVLSGQGGYAVPSASAEGPPGGPPTFQLEKVDGQWRISQAPSYRVLTSYQFQLDYQLRNLYFFDPTYSVLVPDPVYVPLQATAANLMEGLVNDLIHPPADWLSRGATYTAFPKRTTTVGDITLTGGTAAVNLGGGITGVATNNLLQKVSAQLLWTLTGSGQSGPAVQSVELSVNGQPRPPPGSDQNPVQQLHQSKYSPPTGASSTFYYVDAAGNLLSSDGPQAKAQMVAHIGAGYSQIAVSPDRQYLAALNNGSLFIGRVGGPLLKRAGAGYSSMSWDPSDDLWATSEGQIVMLRGAANPAQPQGKPVAVDVVYSDGTSPDTESFTALRVAPDGVRVAIIGGATDLDFGAIVTLPGPRPGQGAVEIVLSPFSVSVPGATFTAVTWYGRDNVITLRDPGPELTEYPVDGGTSTSITAQPHMSWITASSGNPVIAGLPSGGMVFNENLSGTWTAIPGTGISAVYPG